MNDEYRRTCKPMSDQESAVASDAGNLVNWIRNYSHTNGFHDGLKVDSFISTPVNPSPI